MIKLSYAHQCQLINQNSRVLESILENETEIFISLQDVFGLESV